MKKSTKGVVACGAAALILAGGAGSMAAWTASAPSAGGGSATTGHLTVTAAGPATWKWKTVASGNVATVGSTFDPATQTLAPGDSVQLSGSYTLGIKGTNLKAAATVVNGAGGNLGELTFTPDALTTTAGSLTALTPADDGKTVTAGGVLSFPSTATASMDQTVNVSAYTLTVTQQ